MLKLLNGETRVHFIIGDPIRQVHSPYGVTQAFEARDRNAVLLPLGVPSSGLHDFFRGIDAVENIDGLVVTTPHKASCFSVCRTTSARAALLGAVNVMRRTSEGWYGDMFDGLACVAAVRNAGCEPAGRRALVIGAGGAGSAIALGLLDAGVFGLSIYDTDTAQRDNLYVRLSRAGYKLAKADSNDPAGFDLVINATPLGMWPNDPLPIPADNLSPHTFVGDVVTKPEIPPLIALAKQRGCSTHTGIDMAAAQSGLIADFLSYANGSP